jgi:hypothetical protein
MEEGGLESGALDREERELEREEALASQRRGTGTDDVDRRGTEVVDRATVADEPTGGRSGDLHPESLQPLFAADQAEGYRSRWIAIQSSFVDDPRGAVQAGDELVAQVLSELASSFAEQRQHFESQLGSSGAESTENLRVALRSYRSFFDRLLSL